MNGGNRKNIFLTHLNRIQNDFFLFIWRSWIQIEENGKQVLGKHGNRFFIFIRSLAWEESLLLNTSAILRSTTEDIRAHTSTHSTQHTAHSTQHTAHTHTHTHPPAVLMRLDSALQIVALRSGLVLSAVPSSLATLRKDALVSVAWSMKPGSRYQICETKQVVMMCFCILLNFCSV